MQTLDKVTANTLVDKVNQVATLSEDKVKASLAEAIQDQNIQDITAHLIDFISREQSSKGISKNTVSAYSTAVNQYLSYAFENGLNLLKPTVRQSQNYKTYLSEPFEVQQTRVTSVRIANDDPTKAKIIKKVTVDWEYAKNGLTGERVKVQLPTTLKTLGASSINRNLSTAKQLHRMINTVMNKNIANPFDNVKSIKGKAVSNDGAYSAADRAKLFEAATGDLKTVLALTGFGALRITEALTLLWSDIDLKKGTLTIRAEHSKNKDEGTIGISDSLDAFLKQLKPKHGLVVTGNPTRFKIYKQLKALCKKQDVTFKAIHGLRHTALQQTLDVTGSREATMTQGRHKSQSSSNRYAATSLDNVQNMITGQEGL